LEHRIEDLDAILAVAHRRWEAACRAEDCVLAVRSDGLDADEDRFAYVRALALAARQREMAWGEYSRIAELRQRTMMVS
jgi:hypothetical protein